MLWSAVVVLGLLLPTAWLLPGGLELRITLWRKRIPCWFFP